MKTILRVLALSVVMLAFAVNTWAIPTDKFGNVIDNTAGYYWTDAAYWTPTDLTTGADGSGLFMIQVEKAAYESDFGIFRVDDISNPSSVLGHFEVFSYDEEVGTTKSLYFRDNAGSWQVTLDSPLDSGATWTDFDNKFGFYYGVHTGGASDPTVDHTYYSDWDFNTVNAGEQHVAIEYNGVDNAIIHLEDLVVSPDWDWEDMTVFGHDIAPVPEPTTILLSGLGLLGMGAFLRSRKNSKA